MDRTIPEIRIPSFAKERTSFRKVSKYTLVIIKRAMTFGDFNQVPFSGVFIPDLKGIFGYLFFNSPHQTKMTTALPTLHTFKSQNQTSRVILFEYSCIML